jgi:hypothetical protein
VTEPHLPTTPEERRTAGTAWRELPHPVRWQLVAAARRREIPADPVAFWTDRQWAATRLRPHGRLAAAYLGVRRSLRRIVPAGPAATDLSAGPPPSG